MSKVKVKIKSSTCEAVDELCTLQDLTPFPTTYQAIKRILERGLDQQCGEALEPQTSFATGGAGAIPSEKRVYIHARPIEDFVATSTEDKEALPWN